MSRLRQLALAVHDLESTLPTLTDLGFEERRRTASDEFGHQSVVLAWAGFFIELVSPTRLDGGVATFLARNGEGAYLIAFQVEDLEAARSRVDASGARRIRESTQPGITASYIHPKDLSNVLVCIAQTSGRDNWPWGDYSSHSDRKTSTAGLASLTIAVKDPVLASSRWNSILELQSKSEVVFEPSDAQSRIGVVSLSLYKQRATWAAPTSTTIAGVRLDLGTTPASTTDRATG